MIADRIRRAISGQRNSGRKVESVLLSQADARAFEAWAEDLLLFQGAPIKMKGIAVFEGVDILEAAFAEQGSQVELVDVPGLPRAVDL